MGYNEQEMDFGYWTSDLRVNNLIQVKGSRISIAYIFSDLKGAQVRREN